MPGSLIASIVEAARATAAAPRRPTFEGWQMVDIDFFFLSSNIYYALRVNNLDDR